MMIPSLTLRAFIRAYIGIPPQGAHRMQPLSTRGLATKLWDWSIPREAPVPLQLAFSSNAYLDVPVEQAIERIAGFGYRGIELLADVPHAWPAGLLPVQKQAIRTAIEANGLTISNINAFMMNAIADPRQPYWHP